MRYLLLTGSVIVSLCVLISAAAGASALIINFPGSTGLTVASGINARGEVVGLYFVGPETHAFIMTKEGLSNIDVPGASGPECGTEARDINNAGQIAGFYCTGLTFHGFIRERDLVTTLDVPGAQLTFATAINDRGQVLVSSSDAVRSQTFIFDHGTFTNLDIPDRNGCVTTPRDINDAGRIAGTYSCSLGSHGFVFDGRTVVTIDVPGAVDTIVAAINDRGDVVGSYRDAAGGFHGFVMSDGIFNTVDVPEADLTFPLRINNRGQIVGELFFVNGEVSGFVLP